MYTTLFICLLFLADLHIFWVYTTVYVSLLMVAYSVLIWQHEQKKPVIFIHCLLCLEAFLYYNNPLVPLFYLPPITGLAILSKRYLYPTWWCSLLTLVAILTVQILCIGVLLYGIIPSTSYTIYLITANLLSLALVSLIIKRQGNLGNRV